MAILTKNQLSASNASSFPDNTTGAITPQVLRDFNTGVIDTLVDSLNTGSYAITTGSNDFTQANSFTSISASSFVSASVFVGDGSKLTNITASVALPISDEGILLGYATQLNFSGSNISASLQAGIATISVNTNNLVTTSSFNSLTASVNQFTSSTNQFTSSQETKNTTLANVTASLNAYTSSNNTKWSNLGTQSGSWVTETESGSFLITASVNLNTLTFTKGDNTTFAVIVNTGSAQTTDITSLNAFTASQNTKNSTLATYTASVDQKFSNIGSQSGSWITESETGSFAVTNATNRFTSSQIFQNISASAEIKGTYFQGGFAYVDNIQSQLANSDITMFLPAAYKFAVSSSISVTGAVTASYFKGDGSQLTNLPGVVPLTSLNAFTQSQDTKNSTLASVTSSLNSFTASQDTKNSTLATYTASVDQKFSNIGGQSGSWITESETASFARTNVNNNFSVNQTFTNITAVSASFQYVQTTYETSSIIYSSGSNQLGDELTDIQTLSGSVKVQGSLTINGTPVQTSSVDITSLNAFTASQNTKNSTLATYTASVDSSLTNINSFTASNGNISLNSYTASNDTKWSNLAGQTGSYVTSAITASSLVTASVNLNTITFTKGDASTFNITVNTGSGGGTSDLTSLNAFTASQETKNATLGSLTGSFATTGSNTFIGNQTLTGSLFVSGNINMVNGADIVTHHVKAAGSNGLELQNASSGIIVSMGAGGGTQAAFTGAVTANSISASTITGIGNVTDYSASVDNRLDQLEATTSSFVSLNAFTASQETKNATLGNLTGSFATTGSNSFNGNQTITGVLSISSSATYDLDITGGFQATAASRISGSAGILSFAQTNSQVSASLGTAIMGRGYSAFTINQNHIGLYASGSGIAGPNSAAPIGTSGISLTSGSGAFDYYFPITFQTGLGYIDGTISVRTPLSASAGFTASLQNGYAWVGNSLGQNTQVATSSFGSTINTGSFATTGSNSFIGSQSISGSFNLTGSAFGNVVSMSVSSNTASMDFNLGNYFELSASVSPIRIEVSNLKGGVTSTLALNGVTSSTINWSSNVLQPSGSAYTASVSGSNDILSFVAFNSNKVNVVSTLKMI